MENFPWRRQEIYIVLGFPRKKSTRVRNWQLKSFRMWWEGWWHTRSYCLVSNTVWLTANSSPLIKLHCLRISGKLSKTGLHNRERNDKFLYRSLNLLVIPFPKLFLRFCSLGMLGICGSMYSDSFKHIARCGTIGTD